MAKINREHRQPMDGRATMWELFQSNRGLIEKQVSVIRQIREEIWDLKKSLAVVSGDISELWAAIKKPKKEEESGRGVPQFGSRAPLTLKTYEAEAA